MYSDSKFWAFLRKNFPTDSPEARLYFACIASFFLPAGLFGGLLSPDYMSGHAESIGLGFEIWAFIQFTFAHSIILPTRTTYTHLQH